MAAKPVQVSIDTDLLRRNDADPEARERGRSAFIRSAVELYLTARERLEIDSRLGCAYQGQADVLRAEIEDLLHSSPKDTDRSCVETVVIIS